MPNNLSTYYSKIIPTVLDPLYVPQFIFSPVTADLNGDGNQDLIVLGASYPTALVTTPIPQPSRVFFGDGNGHFTPVPSSIFPVESLQTVHPRKVLFGDFNGDSQLDVFVSSHGWDANPFPGEQNRLFLSQPNGTWIDATSSLPQLSDFSHSSALGDINQDGKLDIFVGNGYGGANNILSYELINNGLGQFAKTSANLPINSNSILDFTTGHQFPGSTISDLDGDARQDLIITADASTAFNKNRHTTILWNDGGSFLAANSTALPETQSFPIHIDLDAEPIDINGDGLKDLVIVGTQGNPFYDGWFVQVVRNNGNHSFSDVSASSILAADLTGGIPGQITHSPWAMWVKVLDFNRDGFSDFAVEYNGAQLTQATPLIWMNDGAGHFTTLKVSDFVAPGFEWLLGNAHLVETNNGYSFITPQSYPGSGGLVLTGLVATRPYDGMLGTVSLLSITTADVASIHAGYLVTITMTTSAPVSVGGVPTLQLNNNEVASYTFGSGTSSLTFTYVVQTGNNIADLQVTGLTLPSGASIVDAANHALIGPFAADLAIQVDTTTVPPTSVAQEILGLYSALYNRAADFGGLSYWTGVVSQQPDGAGVTAANAGTTSITLHDATVLGQLFVTTQSTYFNSVYGSLTDVEFITALYGNIGGNTIGIAPGVSYWNGLLHAAEAAGQSVQAARAGTVGQIVRAMVDYDINVRPPGYTDAEWLAAQHRQETIDNKIAVSLAFSNASQQAGGHILDAVTVTDAAFQASTRAIQGVSFDGTTASAAISNILYAVANQDLSEIQPVGIANVGLMG
jgi:hypothetical protein